MLAGTSYKEVLSAARMQYHLIEKRNPRRLPYVRSAYFMSDKVFLNIFWDHLKQKHPSDQVRRLRLYRCAIDALQYATTEVEAYAPSTDTSVILYRLHAVTKEGVQFCVQVKFNKDSGRKDMMSAFEFSR